MERLHGRCPTAKEAEEDSEPGVSLLLKSDLFIFRYLVFCFKIFLGIKYHTFYDFEVYWYVGGKIAGILVSHYPPWPGLCEGGTSFHFFNLLVLEKTLFPHKRLQTCLFRLFLL